MAAFTRLDARPICERGPVADPDLILVADETLQADPAAGEVAGHGHATAAFLNTTRDGSSLAGEYQIPCPVLTADLTTLATPLLGRGSTLSPALGAAGCALAGLGPVDLVLRAVRAELVDLGLDRDELEKNVEAARRA